MKKLIILIVLLFSVNLASFAQVFGKITWGNSPSQCVTKDNISYLEEDLSNRQLGFNYSGGKDIYLFDRNYNLESIVFIHSEYGFVDCNISNFDSLVNEYTIKFGIPEITYRWGKYGEKDSLYIKALESLYINYQDIAIKNRKLQKSAKWNLQDTVLEVTIMGNNGMIEIRIYQRKK